MQIDLEDARYLSEDAEPREDDCVSVGDLLFTRLSGSSEYVGCCAVVKQLSADPLVYPDRVFRARSASDALSSFLVLGFSAPDARRRLEHLARSTAGHQRISLGALREQILPLPPEAEMGLVTEMVDSLLSLEGSLQTSVAVASNRSKTLRRSILRAAFEGRLTDSQAAEAEAKIADTLFASTGVSS